MEKGKEQAEDSTFTYLGEQVQSGMTQSSILQLIDIHGQQCVPTRYLSEEKRNWTSLSFYMCIVVVSQAQSYNQ